MWPRKKEPRPCPKHCWHEKRRMSGPPVFFGYTVSFCCWCDLEREKQYIKVTEPGHGPFATQTIERWSHE